MAEHYEREGLVREKTHMRLNLNSQKLRAIAVFCGLLLFLGIILTQLHSWPSSSHCLITSNAEALDKIADSVDWTRFACVQYVTYEQYLCNSLMLFEILDRLKCRPERLMLYPETWTTTVNADQVLNDETRLLQLARDRYGAYLQPIQVQSKSSGDREFSSPIVKVI